MKRSKAFSVVCSLVMLIMLLAACNTGSPNAQTTAPAPSAAAATVEKSAAPTAKAPEPFGKYDPPITLTTIKGIDSTRTYVSGETWDNNIWTKAYSERLGINFNYLWTCDSSEFDQKLNIAIASDDLPDYFPALEYNQFYRLAKAGKLADITDAFNAYAYPFLKQIDTQSEGLAITQCSVDGKLYGIGGAPDIEGKMYMLWYRSDWAKNVGITDPKTIDDVIKLATAFANNNPTGTGLKTVGFGVDKTLWGNGMGLEGFFAAYGAYPTIWVDDGTGKLVYGAVQPNIKDVLLKLQQLYNSGVVDKEFSIKGEWTEAKDDVVSEKIGMVFGPIWFPDWISADLEKKDKAATWACMPIPMSDGSMAKVPAAITQSNGVDCIKAGAKYPEAVVKLDNLSVALTLDPKLQEGKFHDVKDDKGNTVDTFFYMMAKGPADTMHDFTCAQHVTTALSNTDPGSLTDEEKSYYDRCKAYLDGSDPTGYGIYRIFGPDGSEFVWETALQQKQYMPEGYYGPNTDTMNAKWGNLMSKRDEEFTKIIMGAPISEFDDWVSYWNSQGGQEITNEVNGWYATNKK